ncbi:MAG: hypothetical protein R6W94_04130 [Spirochaetia bacterium]
MYIRLLSMALLLAFIAVAALSGQPTIAQDVAGEPSDPELARIISRGARVELERAGLEVVSGEEAEFHFVGRYTVEDGVTTLDVSIRRNVDGEVMARKRDRAEVGLEFDSRVAALVRELTVDAGIARTRNEVQQDVAGQPPSPSTEPPAEVEVPATARAPRGLQLGAGFSPVLITGGATEYFKYGVMPWISARYQFPIRSASAAAGFYAGGASVLPDVEDTDGTVWLLPFGPEVRVGPAADSAVRVSARLAGGPAAVSIETRQSGRLTKLVPFVLGGMLLTTRLGEHFALGLDASYWVVFEEAYPLMAFLPGVVVTLGP